MSEQPERRLYQASVCVDPDCDEPAAVKHHDRKLCWPHWLAAFVLRGKSSGGPAPLSAVMPPPPTHVPKPCRHAFRWVCPECGVDERTTSTKRLLQLADACRAAGHGTVPSFETLSALNGEPSNV